LPWWLIYWGSCMQNGKKVTFSAHAVLLMLFCFMPVGILDGKLGRDYLRVTQTWSQYSGMHLAKTFSAVTSFWSICKADFLRFVLTGTQPWCCWSQLKVNWCLWYTETSSWQQRHDTQRRKCHCCVSAKETPTQVCHRWQQWCSVHCHHRQGPWVISLSSLIFWFNERLMNIVTISWAI